MLIHTLKKALTQGRGSLTRHRIDLISSLVCALIQVRSVNLRKLACSLPGMAQIDRHYHSTTTYEAKQFFYVKIQRMKHQSKYLHMLVIAFGKQIDFEWQMEGLCI